MWGRSEFTAESSPMTMQFVKLLNGDHENNQKHKLCYEFLQRFNLPSSANIFNALKYLDDNGCCLSDIQLDDWLPLIEISNVPSEVLITHVLSALDVSTDNSLVPSSLSSSSNLSRNDYYSLSLKQTIMRSNDDIVGVPKKRKINDSNSAAYSSYCIKRKMIKSKSSAQSPQSLRDTTYDFSTTINKQKNRKHRSASSIINGSRDSSGSTIDGEEAWKSTSIFADTDLKRNRNESNTIHDYAELFASVVDTLVDIHNQSNGYHQLKQELNESENSPSISSNVHHKVFHDADSTCLICGNHRKGFICFWKSSCITPAPATTMALRYLNDHIPNFCPSFLFEGKNHQLFNRESYDRKTSHVMNGDINLSNLESRLRSELKLDIIQFSYSSNDIKKLL